jgi:hypothetical protein
MSAAAVVSLLVSIFKAIPSLRKWWEELMAAYIEAEKARMSREIRNGIKRLINEQDQIELEETIGYSKPGEPSRLPGAVIVDQLPGVNRVQLGDQKKD